MSKYLYKGIRRKCIQYFFFITLFFISFNTYSQTIPSTGSSTSTCGNCAPAGWLEINATTDISDRNTTGGQATLGGSASWVNAPLPLPPTGDLTWISMRDVGDYGAFPIEKVTANMGEIIAGKIYKVTIHAMTTKSNQDGGTLNDTYYSGVYIDKFGYTIDSYADQEITSVTHDAWGTKEIVFIGTPDVDGKMQITITPLDNAITGGLPINFESVQIAVELNAIEVLDTDGDGISDDIDTDDDNDGIPDTVEATLSGTSYDPLGDEDGDKVPNYLDVTDNGVGDASTTSYIDLNGDGVPDVYDFDNDGIPNHLDLDSDNDGIPDNIEGQSTQNYVAPTGVDTDNDGLDDAYDADCTPCGSVTGAAITPVNTDGGGEADYRDLDSDGDGASDTTEANLVLSGTVGKNGLDNSYDNGGADDYSDVNGSFDNTQSDNFPDGDSDVGTGGAGHDVDYRDADTVGELDTDGDGIPNSTDPDDDNDGILDVTEGAGDFDGDGIPNHLDLDSDNDGIPDNIEGQSTAGYTPPSGVDTDNDGLDDAYDLDCAPCGGVTGVTITPVNTDGTGNADYLDTDADDDGTLDYIEAGLSLSGTVGANGLDNNYDGGTDDYSDVNGSFCTS